MFDYSLEMIYLVALIVIGCCTVLYIFFADIADVAGDGIPLFDPTVILSFLTFTAAAGFILERYLNFESGINIIIAVLVAIGLSALLYYFLLVPLRSAEVSLAYTEQSLEGQVGKIIVPVPIDGFGELVIETANGIISKRTASYHGVEIPYDTRVLIIEMREGTAFVAIYDKEEFIL